MAATAAVALDGFPPVGDTRAGFSTLATTCECCDAESSLYFFNPFRAFCVEHGTSSRRPIAFAPKAHAPEP
jgi:hypothetical protein